MMIEHIFQFYILFLKIFRAYPVVAHTHYI